MHLIFFSSEAWRDWGLQRRPLIRQGMPVLLDDDLLFEDELGVRPTVPVNRWLRELPTSGARSPNTWAAYARALRDWLVFLQDRGADPFGGRDELRAVLGAYAEDRLAGPLERRLAESSWDLHVVAVSRFYEWAVAEGYATAVPFTYGVARRVVGGRSGTMAIDRAGRAGSGAACARRDVVPEGPTGLTGPDAIDLRTSVAA